MRTYSRITYSVRDDDYLMDDTRRKPTTGTRCPTLLNKWRRVADPTTLHTVYRFACSIYKHHAKQCMHIVPLRLSKNFHQVPATGNCSIVRAFTREGIIKDRATSTYIYIWAYSNIPWETMRNHFKHVLGTLQVETYWAYGSR